MRSLSKLVNGAPLTSRRCRKPIGCRVDDNYAACHHVGLLMPEALMRAGLSHGAKVLDLRAVPVPWVRSGGASDILISGERLGP